MHEVEYYFYVRREYFGKKIIVTEIEQYKYFFHELILRYMGIDKITEFQSLNFSHLKRIYYFCLHIKNNLISNFNYNQHSNCFLSVNILITWIKFVVFPFGFHYHHYLLRSQRKFPGYLKLKTFPLHLIMESFFLHNLELM